MAHKKDALSGNRQDSAAAYARRNPEHRERMLRQVMGIRANLGDEAARRHLDVLRIDWEEFAAFCVEQNKNGEQEHDHLLPASFAERLQVHLCDILPLRTSNVLEGKGIRTVADLQTSDTFLRTINNVARKTIQTIDATLLQQLAIRRHDNGTLEDCNGTAS